MKPLKERAYQECRDLEQESDQRKLQLGNRSAEELFVVRKELTLSFDQDGGGVGPGAKSEGVAALGKGGKLGVPEIGLDPSGPRPSVERPGLIRATSLIGGTAGGARKRPCSGSESERGDDCRRGRCCDERGLSLLRQYLILP
ncbi:hypothetical protein Agabi119p4_5626 [Agaricus bisporus var. burnettii]|uniref:Uncharacterized protein n=1 Tax=Agaricus bisporus var. burnettii TaxID=192524 RepID=A0A8H7KGQ9_AGABI|nr:hypothetical protein Agabi119p4_5626 [Agaricus bisporus var. burnettii]